MGVEGSDVFRKSNEDCPDRRSRVDKRDRISERPRIESKGVFRVVVLRRCDKTEEIDVGGAP